jgi:hypothetical protein
MPVSHITDPTRLLSANADVQVSRFKLVHAPSVVHPAAHTAESQKCKYDRLAIQSGATPVCGAKIQFSLQSNRLRRVAVALVDHNILEQSVGQLR